MIRFTDSVLVVGQQTVRPEGLILCLAPRWTYFTSFTAPYLRYNFNHRENKDNRET